MGNMKDAYKGLCLDTGMQGGPVGRKLAIKTPPGAKFDLRSLSSLFEILGYLGGGGCKNWNNI